MTLDVRKIDPAVCEIIAKLTTQGHEAYVVGGAVRDLLLAITPKDYDIATSARPEEVKRVFGRRARIIGRRFRLVHVYGGGNIYEVCTFRREPTSEERSTREGDDGVTIWNDNEFGTRDQDAIRRDFTVNAIYYDPLKEGRLLDPVGGVPDLRAGVVRMIGDPGIRLAEDPVRLLRALKLVAHYGLRLEPALDRAVHQLAPRIAASSRARCFEELLKIMAKPWAFKTFAVCQEYGLLRHYWPNLAAAWTGKEGPLLQRLLELRDQRMSEDNAFLKSKTLGLATLAYASVTARHERGRHAERAAAGGADERPDIRHVLREFYEPYTVPRFLQARTRDAILMVPRLLDSEPAEHLVRHPQYRYARELAYLLSGAEGWDTLELDLWPSPPEHVRPPREQHDRQRQSRRFGRDPRQPHKGSMHP